MIRIITDSSSDISQERAKELGIEVMPLTVRFDDQVYKSGIDITNDEFYSKLTSSKNLPATAQVNPFEFEERFRAILEEGDEIVCLLISSELSGTYQSAVIAKENLSTDKITVIDSKNVCSALGVLAMIAVNLRDQGIDRAEITKTIQSYIPKLHLYVVLETLDYLKKGGRISPTVAFVGGVLGLHPIVSIIDGKVEMVDKAKGKKSAVRWISEQMEKVPQKKGLPVLVGHSMAEENAGELIDILEKQGVTDISGNVCMGPIIGTYTGLGALGVFYIED